MNKERPILFSAPMVRAILAGTKTQTRRIVKAETASWDHVDCKTPVDNILIFFMGGQIEENGLSPIVDQVSCPYGSPRDRLWVRETYRFLDNFDGDSPSAVGELALNAGYSKPWAPTLYEADGATDNWIQVGTPTNPPTPTRAGKSRPSIHMPRWASRIDLEITGVRLERLQGISEEDACAEGAPGYEEGIDPPPPDERCEWSYQASFHRLWESINGPGSWDANPWVWVVEFRRVGHADQT